MTKKAVHGSGSMEALEAVLRGDARREGIYSADVLDAWYPPSPLVIERVKEHLPLLISASPPTHGDGLRSTIAGCRGIAPESVLVGSGSSSLMFIAIPQLLAAGERCLVLDPMYGEYAHIAENVVGASVDRFELAMDGFKVDVPALAERSKGAKLLAIVNPNSPTGIPISLTEIRQLCEKVLPDTYIWIDETYIDYFSLETGVNQSAEGLVAEFSNLIVSKSMSKFYSLSGIRVGYLVADPQLVDRWDMYTPSWSVGSLATVAGEQALGDLDYYSQMAAETRRLKAGLVADLKELELVDQLTEGVANFVLVRLSKPVASEMVKQLATKNVFVRDCKSLSERFENDTVRISVLDQDANRVVVSSIAEFEA